MKGYRLNPDADYIKSILEGIQKREGHCPCRVNVDDTTLCPCDVFIEDGVCQCGLFIPIIDE